MPVDSEDPILGARARRAVPLIAAALAVIVVASLLYLRATAPQPPHILQGRSAPAPPHLDSQYHVEYDFTSPDVGWADVVRYAAAPRFWIFRTADGARHWRSVFAGDVLEGAFISIHFFDGDHGIVVADRVYSTGDGGATWTVISIPDQTPDFTFATDKAGWALDAGSVYATADGGLTWRYRATLPVAATFGGKGGLASLEFRADGEGWMGSQADRPTVYATSDGGTSWRSVALPGLPNPSVPAGKPYFFTTWVKLLPGGGVAAFAIDDFGQQATFRSYDGGSTWKPIRLPDRAEQIGFFSFVDRDNWFVSLAGLLYRTADGGVTWRSVVSNMPDSLADWSVGITVMIDTRHGWAPITSPGFASTGLAVTSDGGANWAPAGVPQPA